MFGGRANYSSFVMLQFDESVTEDYKCSGNIHLMDMDHHDVLE